MTFVKQTGAFFRIDGNCNFFCIRLYFWAPTSSTTLSLLLQPTTLMKSRILSDSPTNFLPTYFDISSKSFSAFCFLPLSPFYKLFLQKKEKKDKHSFLHDGITYPFEQNCKSADTSVQICVATPSNFLKVFLFSV